MYVYVPCLLTICSLVCAVRQPIEPLIVCLELGEPTGVGCLHIYSRYVAANHKVLYFPMACPADDGAGGFFFGGGIAGERTCLQGLSSYRMIITADMLSICTYILGRKWRPLVPVSLSRLVSGTCSGFPPGHQHASADFGLARPHNGGIPRRRPSPAHGKPLDARAVWFSSGSRGGRRVVVPAGRVLVEMGGVLHVGEARTPLFLCLGKKCKTSVAGAR